jgi:U4/U6 small nuclear ribonucleoprotein PRP4
MLYSIPAHKSLISHVKFEPQEGDYLATSSYDTKAAVCFICKLGQFNPFTQFSSLILNTFCLQLWSTRDYKPIKSLAGHESKVTSLDISGGNHLLKHLPSFCRIICVIFFLE